MSTGASSPVAGRPVFVLGLPRSGTTWTAHVLGRAPGTVTVLEPDNEKTSVAAVAAKHALGRFPVLGPADDAAGYRHLWAWALAGGGPGPGARPRPVARLGGRLFASAGPAEREALAGGRPSARLRLAGYLARPPQQTATPGPTAPRVVAKSVHAGLAAEWMADTFSLDVLVVLRHPANVLASWLALGLPDRDRQLDRLPAVRDRYLRRWGIDPPGPEPIERAVWQLGLLTAALEEAAARHPAWLVRTHEDVCADPPGEFRRLYRELGLEWTAEVDAEIEEGDRPGSGYDLQRRARDEAGAWRTRLGHDELATLRRVLAPFPLQHWSAADLQDDTCAG